MVNKEFGKLVKSLRKQRTYFDENQYPRQWSQQKLSAESGLSVRQIARIEQGTVVDLKEHLEKLAAAFGLTETEKIAFYAEAGYVYSIEQKGGRQESLRVLLEQLPYPATVRNPLWDFVAMNAYHWMLRGFNQEALRELDEGDLGPNLLRVLFDPYFQQASTAVNEKNIRVEAVWAFRAASFRYVRTKRYRFLINELKRYPEFERAWRLSESLPDYGSENAERRQPVSRIDLPRFGEMELLSLRLPQRYFGEIEVAVYVPLASSEQQYQTFRDSVAQNSVTFFRERPFDW